MKQYHCLCHDGAHDYCVSTVVDSTLEFTLLAKAGATVIFHGTGLINIGFVGIKLIMFLIR